MPDREATAPAPDGVVKSDWVLVAFGVWTILGLFLDGWAHSARRPDSFFTPWHGVLYTGGAGVAATTLWQARRAMAGASWKELVRYDPVALIGLLLFGAGGAGDLIWHEVFGVEVNVAALLSPTHLMLMTGGVLALSAPFRRAGRRTEARPTLPSFLPALVSLSLATGVAFFFTFYASPFGHTIVPAFRDVTTDIHDLSRASAAGFAQVRQMWALTGILFTTVLVVVPVLALIRRWRPPAGSFVVLFGFVALFAAAASEFSRWPAPIAVLIAGAVGEALLRRTTDPWIIAAAVPAALWASYFTLIAATYGMGWSPELWAGAIVLTSAVGGVLGFVIGSRPSAMIRGRA